MLFSDTPISFPGAVTSSELKDEADHHVFLAVPDDLEELSRLFSKEIEEELLPKTVLAVVPKLLPEEQLFRQKVKATYLTTAPSFEVPTTMITVPDPLPTRKIQSPSPEEQASRGGIFVPVSPTLSGIAFSTITNATTDSSTGNQSTQQGLAVLAVPDPLASSVMSAPGPLFSQQVSSNIIEEEDNHQPESNKNDEGQQQQLVISNAVSMAPPKENTRKRKQKDYDEEEWEFRR